MAQNLSGISKFSNNTVTDSGKMNMNHLVAIAVQTTVMLAAQIPLSKEYYQWTRAYLNSVKTTEGKMLPNVVGLLKEVKEFEIRNNIDDELIDDEVEGDEESIDETEYDDESLDFVNVMPGFVVSSTKNPATDPDSTEGVSTPLLMNFDSQPATLRSVVSPVAVNITHDVPQTSDTDDNSPSRIKLATPQKLFEAPDPGIETPPLLQLETPQTSPNISSLFLTPEPATPKKVTIDPAFIESPLVKSTSTSPMAPPPGMDQSTSTSPIAPPPGTNQSTSTSPMPATPENNRSANDSRPGSPMPATPGNNRSTNNSPATPNSDLNNSALLSSPKSSRPQTPVTPPLSMHPSVRPIPQSPAGIFSPGLFDTPNASPMRASPSNTALASSRSAGEPTSARSPSPSIPKSSSRTPKAATFT